MVLKKKRIIFFIGRLGFGGAERVLVYLANEFSKNSHDIHVILLAKSKESVFHIHPEIKVHNVFTTGNKLTRSIKRFFAIRNYVKEINPTIVISFLTSVNVNIATAMIGLKIPLILSERNNPYTDPKNKMLRIWRKLVYRFADGYVFQTEEVKDFFSSSIRLKGTIIPNPLHIEEVENWAGNKSGTIVAVGRLVEEKNHKLLIDAFSKISEEFPLYKLIIYGEGYLRNELTSYINELGLEEKIKLPGVNSNVLDEIQKANLFVLPSNYEGMPNSLIEAMALGVPVISTECGGGGPAYLISNNVNGILVPINDSIALTRSMKKILSNSNFAFKLGKNAQESITSRLNKERIFGLWESYIIQIGSKKS
ncbi:glycosyltransferase family 4 protein [Neobacillus drentensis]|uniref:glycosyltransferase family 4 protein n=1 Tax=Neobacillus drentensis TaxID=220684 RepID=UPI002FFD8A69